MLQGLTRDRFVDLCFFNSLVIFSSSELGSRGLLYSSSSSLSELSFSFSVSESCFFFAEAISAACRFRHLVRLFWNQTWAPGTAQPRRRAAAPGPPDGGGGTGPRPSFPPARGPGAPAAAARTGAGGAAGEGACGDTRGSPALLLRGRRQPELRDSESSGFAEQTTS